jgi:FMN-dependent NADH-azoreductase
MSKTLLVHFSPREGSHSKTLLEHFKKTVEGKTELIDTDLTKDLPSFFPVSDDGKAFNTLNEADMVVFAFPIWNFDMPAARAYGR